MRKYEAPRVQDYGTLQEMTAGGGAFVHLVPATAKPPKITGPTGPSGTIKGDKGNKGGGKPVVGGH
jgi:hypothetical protein